MRPAIEEETSRLIVFVVVEIVSVLPELVMLPATSVPPEPTSGKEPGVVVIESACVVYKFEASPEQPAGAPRQRAKTVPGSFKILVYGMEQMPDRQQPRRVKFF